MSNNISRRKQNPRSNTDPGGEKHDNRMGSYLSTDEAGRW